MSVKELAEAYASGDSWWIPCLFLVVPQGSIERFVVRSEIRIIDDLGL